MRTLIPAEDIARRVAQLGEEISALYRGQPLTVIGVLHGSIVLVADLMRALTVPHRLGFVMASSYRGRTTTGADLTISLDLLPDVAGRHVLLVDDIFDTGRTLTALAGALETRGVASLKTAVLLWKQGRSVVDRVPDFAAFEIPDVFVVGYGLDYNDDYRHLPEIAVLDEHDVARATESRGL